jgi:xylulokinase
MDASTGEECREIAATVGGDDIVCAKSGSIAVARFTGPQIRRFYKHQPKEYKETTKIHLVSSFMCSVLCGSDAPIDTGDGAGMNLLNIHNWTWDQELLDATAPGLLAKLPPVVPGCTMAGKIASYFVKKYHFKDGVPVAVFTGGKNAFFVAAIHVRC